MSQDCIFCTIASGESDTKIVAESDHAVVFNDISPKAPVHLLVVPKKHLNSLEDAGADDADMLGDLLLLAQRAAREQGIAQAGYKLAMNVGEGAGQIVDHIHLHVLGGWKNGPGDLEV